jgi:hypothetical protein
LLHVLRQDFVQSSGKRGCDQIRDARKPFQHCAPTDSERAANAFLLVNTIYFRLIRRRLLVNVSLLVGQRSSALRYPARIILRRPWSRWSRLRATLHSPISSSQPSSALGVASRVRRFQCCADLL